MVFTSRHNHKKLSFLLLAFIAFVTISGCFGGKNSIDLGTPFKDGAETKDPVVPLGPTPTPTHTPTPTPQPKPMVFRMTSSWEAGGNGQTNIIDSRCEVPAGSPSGTVQNCTLSVPEAQLYFSKFDFELFVPSNTCDLVRFYPYYYKASNSVSALLEWNGQQTISCTGNDPKCYSGPATEMVPNFPNATHFVSSPGQAAFHKVWTAHSAFLKGRLSNRWMANTLPLGSRSVSITSFSVDGYVANSMQDWAASCQNAAGVELYRINLTITPTSSAFYDVWEDAPLQPPSTDPMTLKISTIWDNDEPSTTPEIQITCQVTSASQGGVTSCIANINEAQLYYSKLKFNLDVLPGTCNVIEFHPYSYQVADFKDFVPPWKPTLKVDCSGINNPVLPIECFDGPGTDLVPGFPQFRFLVYLPAELEFAREWTMSSALKKVRNNNRWASNMLIDQVSSLPEIYVGQTMKNYFWGCYDEQYELQYGIALTVKDVNGPFNQVQSWFGL